jgi:hypothetical protein
VPGAGPAERGHASEPRPPTFTVRTNGPDSASATATDLLPRDKLTVVGSLPAQGSYDAATGVWDVGMLASGAQTTLQIQAQAVASTSGWVSPPIANYIGERELLRSLRRAALTPLVYGVKHPAGDGILLGLLFVVIVRRRAGAFRWSRP